MQSAMTSRDEWFVVSIIKFTFQRLISFFSKPTCFCYSAQEIKAYGSKENDLSDEEKAAMEYHLRICNCCAKQYVLLDLAPHKAECEEIHGLIDSLLQNHRMQEVATHLLSCNRCLLYLCRKIRNSTASEELSSANVKILKLQELKAHLMSLFVKEGDPELAEIADGKVQDCFSKEELANWLLRPAPTQCGEKIYPCLTGIFDSYASVALRLGKDPKILSQEERQLIRLHLLFCEECVEKIS